MRAIILAAGRGRRMGGFAQARPKCLLNYRGRPLLDWQLDAIRGAGVTRIGIVTGYRRELIAPYGLAEFHNPRWRNTNMVRSLEVAHSWLEADACLVCYADLFYDASALQGLVLSNAPLAIAYDPNWLRLWSRRFADPLEDAETFRLASDKTLAEIGGRPTHTEEVEGQYMGLLRIEPQGWGEMRRRIDALPQREADQLQMTHLLQHIVRAGAMPVATTAFEGEWGEYDVPSDLATGANSQL